MKINTTRYSGYNYRRLVPFLKAVQELPEKAFTFTHDGYEPLSIESLGYSFRGYPVWGMMHTYEMNGDIIRDPDITFLVDWESGNIVPHTFQQDNCSASEYGTLYQEVWPDENHYCSTMRTELDEFLKTWITNIIDQGFNSDQTHDDELTPEEFAASIAD